MTFNDMMMRIDARMCRLSRDDNARYRDILTLAHQVVNPPKGADPDQCVADDYVMDLAGLPLSYSSHLIVRWEKWRNELADAVELDGHIAAVVELAA